MCRVADVRGKEAVQRLRRAAADERDEPFAIAARKAATVQSASQTKWGMASSSRKKTVSRERRPSSSRRAAPDAAAAPDGADRIGIRVRIPIGEQEEVRPRSARRSRSRTHRAPVARAACGRWRAPRTSRGTRTLRALLQSRRRRPRSPADVGRVLRRPAACSPAPRTATTSKAGIASNRRSAIVQRRCGCRLGQFDVERVPGRAREGRIRVGGERHVGTRCVA